ncbi:MAG: hypothetical protein J0H74_30410 [Chitinophagaceae bacterium]|nr:hypothetical protein [Chitinophagaceae bacterium]
MDKMIADRRLAGGMPLTLNGKVVRGKNASSATALVQSCSIFKFDGYAEVREIMSLPVSPAGNGTSISAKSLLSSSAPDGPSAE